MAVYAGAMYCFAAELAFVPRRREAKSLAAVGATSYDDPAQVVDPDVARLERSDRLGRVAVALTGLAFLLHLAAIVARGLSAGRAPWGNMFEFSTTGALAVTGAFLVLLLRRDPRFPVRYLGLFVVGPVLLTLGLAVTVLYVNSEQLVPALRSFWLVIHVTAAMIASGILTI